LLPQGSYHLTPLSYEPLEHAASFASEEMPEGFVAFTGSSLRLFTIQNFGSMFNQTEVPLRYTPRQMVQVRTRIIIIVVIIIIVIIIMTIIIVTNLCG
jgi:hypothetical protein